MIEWGPDVQTGALPPEPAFLARLGSGIMHVLHVAYDRLTAPRSEHQVFVDRMAMGGAPDLGATALINYANRGDQL